MLWDLLTFPIALLGFAITGGIVGVIARWIVPGVDDLGLLRTVVLGMVGSVLAGFAGALLFGGANDSFLFLPTGGFLTSILGAIVALLVYRAVRNR
jgi:uncharacterized membrane protein YeaQ/YmgE (transglycosylase-associated protein family)